MDVLCPTVWCYHGSEALEVRLAGGNQVPGPLPWEGVNAGVVQSVLVRGLL